ncbi:hypothetical protein [Moorena producens]|uniref:hypothetical protein n=1 Tax=Moorena producens TaxID=1155739 RepID=UPI000AF64B33|nr:hypothetical protein [Moorena producens]
MGTQDFSPLHYSLLPAPCSLLPAPYSLLPIPYSLFPPPKFVTKVFKKCYNIIFFVL